MSTNIQLKKEYKLKSNQVQGGYYFTQLLVIWLILDRFNASIVLFTIFYVLACVFILFRLSQRLYQDAPLTLENLVYGILNNQTSRTLNDLISKN